MPYLCFVWPLNAHILQVTVTGAYIISFCCFTMHRGNGTDHKYCNCFDAHLFQDGLWYCSAPACVQINIRSNHSYGVLMVMNTQACSRYTSHAEMYYTTYIHPTNTHMHTQMYAYTNIHAHSHAYIHPPPHSPTQNTHKQLCCSHTYTHEAKFASAHPQMLFVLCN